VQEKMVPNHELPESNPLHGSRLNYETNICELEDHVGEKGWSSNWPTKLGPAKNDSFYKFSQSLARKHLNRIRVSLWPIASPRRGKTKHHWGGTMSKCQVATLYGSCANLSNGK
jgi:hypothetical protein